jgi:hypothetical protein
MTNYDTYLNINNIVWSKGCNNGDYKDKCTEHVSDNNCIIKLIKDLNMTTATPNVLWIRTTSITNRPTDLDILSINIAKINKPFILITSDGDRPVPSSYNINTVNAILNNDKVLGWFTQNYDRSIIHDKLKNMPIGLDLHTSNWFINNSNAEKLEYMIRTRMECSDKISNKIFSDCHLNYSHIERRRLHNIILQNKDIYFLDKGVGFQNITNLYNKYQFVLSPRGNGLDCHRTWELFLSGAIIITKTTPLDKMFIDNNLPVVILQDWSELNENLQDKLILWYNKYLPLTSVENIFPKMTFQYWLNAGR